jgi:hypothetical protein
VKRSAQPRALQPRDGLLDLLFIHPHGHLLSDWLVPIGALTAVNRVEGRKLGVYSWECTDEQIRAARVVALDWYWHFSLPAVRAVANRVRRLNPAAPIVVGGLTASWFGRRTFELLPVDYVAVGDAEAGMAGLVEMGARRGGAGTPPNLLGADGGAGPRVTLDREEFDRLDPVSSDWFPSLTPERASPFILLVRGCDAPCGRTCLASEVSLPPLRVHSPEWLSSVVRRTRKGLGPTACIRLVNVGARDESALIGTLDLLSGDPAVGPIAIWTYGLSREFLDYALDRCPDAAIGLVSPWETLGWPHRTVSDVETIPLMEPIEHLVSRLRERRRGTLVFHCPRLFQERHPGFVERISTEQTVLMPSESFYIWTPESPGARDMDTVEQRAKMEAMGDLGARILLLEKVVPGLLNFYPMRGDPQPPPSDDPPVRELLAFHQLVLDGWRRWGMQVPDPFDFEVHWVRPAGGNRPHASLQPSLPDLLEAHPVLGGASVHTTERDVELIWTSVDVPVFSDEPSALVVLPRGLAEYVSVHSVEVLFLPVPPGRHGGFLHLSLKVDPSGIRLKASWQSPAR